MWWQHLIAPTVIATPVFVVLVIAEMAYIRITGRGGKYETRDMAASILMGLGSVIVPALITFGFAGWLSRIIPWRAFDIGWSIPALIACFVLDDLRYYWGKACARKKCAAPIVREMVEDIGPSRARLVPSSTPV